MMKLPALHNNPSDAHADSQPTPAHSQSLYSLGEDSLDPEKFSSRPTLKERGWTDSMINALLPTPDYKRRNPYYRCAGAMKFYSNRRVMLAEQSDEWKRRKAIAERRSEAATDAADRRWEKMEKFVERIAPPRLRKKPLEKIRKAAYASWSAMRSARGKSTDPLECIDPATLDRISVNYIRHELSSYDQLLDTVKGSVGADYAREALRTAVLTSIADAYPELADEVALQELKALEVDIENEFPW